MDISQAVQDYRDELERQVQARLEQREQDNQARNQQRKDEFRTWVDKAFSPAMVAALKLTTATIEVPEYSMPVLTFEAMGRTFELRANNLSFASLCLLRKDKGAEDGGWFYRASGGVSDDHSMIAAMADVFAAEDHSIAAIAEAEQAQHIRDEARAAALEMHQRCVARIERFRAAILPWEWPRFREIEIAHWRWCTAPAADGGEPEYNDGYSLQHRIYESGKLKLEAERHKPHAARTVVLPESAIPIASITTVTRLAQLPEPLVQHRTVTVSGIREDYTQHDAEGSPLLVEDEAAVMKIELPERWPLAWVRDALTR